MKDIVNSSYPTEVDDVYPLFYLAVRHSWVSLKRLWLPLCLLTLCFALPSYLSDMGKIGGGLSNIIIFLLAFYLMMLVMYISHQTLSGTWSSLGDAISGIRHKMLPLLVGLCVLMVPLVIVMLMFSHLDLDTTQASAQFLVLVVGAAIMYIYILSFFMFPLMLIMDQSVFRCLSFSARLVIHKWYRVVVIYALFVLIVVTVLPTSHHMALLLTLHLNIPFILLILMLFFPLAVNFWLFMLHDMRLRLPQVAP